MNYSRFIRFNFNQILSTKYSTVGQKVFASSNLIISRFKWKSLKEIENSNIETLTKFMNRCVSLEHLNFRVDHPIHRISHFLRETIDNNGDETFSEKSISSILNSIQILNDEYNNVLNNVSEDSNEIIFKYETGLRVRLLKNYLTSILKSIEEKDIDITHLTKSHLNRLVESFLIGSGSERIVQHILLYGEKLNQIKLQECFYTLYEPEVMTCESILTSFKSLEKKNIKSIPKFSKNYLLDVMELNIKSRCVFNWSDPNFQGFTALSNEVLINSGDLLRSRLQYFPESSQLAKKYVQHLITDRQLEYNETKEFRDNCKIDILGLTYSEFDNFVGPQLRYAYPVNCLSGEEFERLSDYVIVDKHLTNKMIVVQTENFQFANYSLIINNSKYDRNALLFAFGVLTKKDFDLNLIEIILKKVSYTLFSMEVESEFLFNSISKASIPSFFSSLYKQLFTYGEAFYRFNESNIVTVQLFKYPLECNAFETNQVPIWLVDKSALYHLPLDLSLQHLIPFIDGVRTMENISFIAEMELECIEKSIKLLLYYKYIFISDVFKFSNIYDCLYRIFNETDAGTIDEVVNFSCEIPNSERKYNCIYLLLNLRPGLSLGDVIASLFSTLDFEGIDIRKLIAISVYKKLIVRI